MQKFMNRAFCSSMVRFGFSLFNKSRMIRQFFGMPPAITVTLWKYSLMMTLSFLPFLSTYTGADWLSTSPIDSTVTKSPFMSPVR